MSALKYWLWLTTRRGIDAVGALTVLEYFSSPELAYYADPEEYPQLPLSPAARASLLDKSMDAPEAILASCQRLNIHILTYQDAVYPARLRQLSDPPAVLYVQGKLFHFDEEAAVAIVGSREPSNYGERWTERLAMELSSGGALVVSGIAEGLDTCALQGALKGGGPVVSVLAGGADVPFPPRNRRLYEDVAAAGALISEYPPGTPHFGRHFPQRNRILSGLCLGVLVVECRTFGGTINTLMHAGEQNRDIFAVPGMLDSPLSEGPHSLIQQGAKLVTCGRDILEEYWARFPLKLAAAAPLPPEKAAARLRARQEETPPVKAPPEEPQPPAKSRTVIPREQQRERFTDDELAVLAALAGNSRSADQLVEAAQIPARRILSALTMLQLQGCVEEHPGKRFSSLVELEE
ncbi:MAG: DNA-protecting protein DprA [Lawsonibacter sp.]|nr:DNA-protecting protein DprA [Lawsonibacter sp.]